MKDKILLILAYLISKKTITYSVLLITLMGIIITSIVNYEVKIQIQIERLNEIKEKTIQIKEIELKPLIYRKKELQKELEVLNKRITLIKECIDGITSTLDTFKEYNCEKDNSIIPKASAEEEVINASEEIIIKSEPIIETGWLKNLQGQSKSKEELRGNTFTEISEAHGISYDYWHNAEIKYKVKKEVALCIARADSGLGKYLKTKNNIGNVGNNDRGDKVAFNSMEQGVEAIFKVLNNKYLSHKQSIGSLSPGGGGNSPFYATSKENWNVNVRNCLSVINGQPIGNNYKIRL